MRVQEAPEDVQCRIMSTRRCPAVYQGVCGDRPCARFESEDEGPWLDELPLRPVPGWGWPR